MLRSTLTIAASAQQVLSAALLSYSIGPVHPSFPEGLTIPPLKSAQSDLSAAFAAGIAFGASSFVTRMRARRAPLLGPPCQGQESIPGHFLRIRPADDQNLESLLAVTEDARFRDPALYRHFEEFLPGGFFILAPPTDQNCFASALGIAGVLGGEEFDDLRRHSYGPSVCSGFQAGDLVVYFAGVMDPYPTHAGILIDPDTVRSRFGTNSPEIGHPLRSSAVLRLYTGHFGFFNIYRSTKSDQTE